MVESVSLFYFIEAVQQEHGIRTDDYVRYRQFCTRKLRRLRSKFNLLHTPKATLKISVELCKANNEILHLVLFKCEWFWAQISQLRNESINISRKKHHLRSICLHSLKCINKLRKLSQESLEQSSELRLEYLAYVNFIEGTVRNELKEYSASILALEKSKMIVQELIQRNSNVSVMNKKLSDIETIIRVCKYSADMHDIDIEVEVEDDLNNFKVIQLTDKMSQSEINENSKILKFGPNEFLISPEIEIGALTSQSLKIAQKIQGKYPVGSSEYQQAQLQLVYFENKHLSKVFGSLFKKMVRNSNTRIKSDSYDKGYKICTDLLKIMSSLKGCGADSIYFELVEKIKSFLFNLSIVFGGKKLKNFTEEKVENSAKIGLDILISLKDDIEIAKLYKFKVLLHILIVENELKNVLRYFIGKNLIQPAALILPKATFYDIAYDFLNLNSSTTAAAVYNDSNSPNEKTPSISKGISGIISSFWGKK